VFGSIETTTMYSQSNHYATVKEAFESLNIDKKCPKLLVRRRLKELHKVMDCGRMYIYKQTPRNTPFQSLPTNLFGPYGREGFYMGGNTASHVLFQTFNNNDTILSRIFVKSIRAACSGDKVIFFSDVYTHYPEKHNMLLDCVTKYNGPPIYSFKKTYPKLPFQNGWFPPKKFKMINTGYERFYRGTLSGIIVG